LAAQARLERRGLVGGTVVAGAASEERAWPVEDTSAFDVFDRTRIAIALTDCLRRE
jgi:hypothetical protein